MCVEVLASVDVMALQAGIAGMVTVLLVCICVIAEYRYKNRIEKHAKKVEVCSDQCCSVNQSTFLSGAICHERIRDT